jgi:hypothetical protein
VALSLAKDLNLDVPSFCLRRINGKSALVITSFDRLQGARIPLVSAMTMLGSLDNEQRSYTAFHIKLPFLELDYTASAKCRSRHFAPLNG